MSGKQTAWQTYGILLVASLGYFVDIYDLILFNVVKKESLEAIMAGATASEITNTGLYLFNMQMVGMLIGGVLWGVWGDKKGRLSVLFGSILLYSAANIINAFVHNIPLYAVIRLIAGMGLAGELGAGITLVSESMSKEKRGYGTMLVVTVGALGAVVAGLVSSKGTYLALWLSGVFNTSLANWQVAYIIGGVLGLLLLMLRIGTFESGMFKSIEHANVQRGNFFMLFNNRQRFFKYLRCILIGLPVWFLIGLLVANSQQIWAGELKITGPVVNGDAVMYAYIGLSVGDLISGLLSQLWQSRRKVVILYLLLSGALTVYYLFFAHNITPGQFYLLSFLAGLFTGYWALFVTIAAEQFGTNIRSTVTNTVPNFVRGAVVLITGLFQWLVALKLGNPLSALIVGILCCGLALWAIWQSGETFGKSLEYTE